MAVPPLQVGGLAAYESVRRRVASHPEIRPEHAADHLTTWDAAVALCSGRFTDAEHLAATVTPSFSVRQRVAEFQLVLADLERGAHAHVSRWVTDYASSAPELVAPHAMLAWLRAEAGDRAGAAEHVETLRRRRSLDQIGWGAPLALRYLAEVAARLGHRDLAAALLPVLTKYAGQMLVSFTAMTIDAAADRAIGLARLTLGHHNEAVRGLAAALRLEDSIGAEALAARTAYWHARALLARDAPGDAEGAQRLADRTVRTARQLGMRRVEADALALKA